MKVIITPAQTQIPEVDTLSHSFRAMGGSNTLINGHIEFPFSSEGENYFTPEAYALCDAVGLKVEQGTFYTVQPASLMDNLVPVGFPEAKHIVDGEEVRRQYQEYFPWHWDLGDGTFLIHVVKTDEFGKKVSYSGLSDDHRKVFQEELGVLLVKSIGEALKPEPVIPE